MAKFWYRKCVRHSSNVFVETIKTGATFLCTGQVDFPSFLKVLESITAYKFLPFVYLNTQENSRTETLFKLIQDG
ncbi:hypothetical protein T07_10714 [Trichinella nelsoni]|uniref:Uncharacterized protein n=1 Tax=Trichinella nelsoni TaxID=6336 RepID=A0A0V0SBM0_9BILA|nr:hypothetical protein T07_10714 [Trichinella nelsoni]